MRVESNAVNSHDDGPREFVFETRRGDKTTVRGDAAEEVGSRVGTLHVLLAARSPHPQRRLHGQDRCPGTTRRLRPSSVQLGIERDHVRRPE